MEENKKPELGGGKPKPVRKENGKTTGSELDTDSHSDSGGGESSTAESGKDNNSDYDEGRKKNGTTLSKKDIRKQKRDEKKVLRARAKEEKAQKKLAEKKKKARGAKGKVEIPSKMSLDTLNSIAEGSDYIKHMETCDLSRQEMAVLPDKIGLLSNLKVLYLYDNKLPALPPVIGTFGFSP